LRARLDLQFWARPTFTVLWAEVAIPAHAYFSRDWLAIYDDIATTKYQLCDRRICSWVWNGVHRRGLWLGQTPCPGGGVF
jgi:hypothetical protein